MIKLLQDKRWWGWKTIARDPCLYVDPNEKTIELIDRLFGEVQKPQQVTSGE